LADHNIQAILLMDKGGIPLFFMKLDPKVLDIDPMLVSKTEGKEIAKRFGGIYLESSVKLNENVDDSFSKMAKMVLETR